MSTALQTIQEKAQQLSPQQQTELLNYIEKLLREEPPRQRTKMKFDWADQPGAEPEPLSSVELQHKANDWRDEDLNAEPK